MDLVNNHTGGRATKRAHNPQRSIMGTNNNPFSLMALAALKHKTAGRKQRAIAMHASGKSLEEIAKQLGISTRTVRRYIADTAGHNPKT